MRENISNALSIVNLTLGLVSLFFIFQELYLYASFLILIAVVIDMSDGIVSRILKIDSDFGKNLDNLCDIVSFIFTPAMLSYVIFRLDLSPTFEYLFFILIIFFVVSAIHRTARINVTHTPGIFNGMPTTFNGIIFPILYITNFFSFYIVSGWLIISSVLMLSKFKIKRPSFKRKKKMVEVEATDEEEEEEKSSTDDITPLPIFGD